MLLESTGSPLHKGLGREGPVQSDSCQLRPGGRPLEWHPHLGVSVPSWPRQDPTEVPAFGGGL